MAQHRSRWSLAGQLLLCVMSGCLAWPLVSCQRPELTHLSNEDPQFPVPTSCGQCHVAIYEEWEHSPHAAAFVRESFRRATDDYRFRECIGCHAPQPMLTSAKPQARAAQCELGVLCVSCHLDQGAMVGPSEPTGLVRPHPILVDAVRFENGTLCGRCHQSTLLQWQSAKNEKRRDCRECHMPEIHRTMTQATDLISRPIVAAETAGVEHRHSFTLTTDQSDKSFDVRVERSDGGLGVTLANMLPHNLPTGDFGIRIIRVIATGTDAEHKQVPLGDWEITGTIGSSLPAGSSRTWQAGLPAGMRHIAIEILHEQGDPSRQIVLLRKEVVLP
jgi:hypothetical protein